MAKEWQHAGSVRSRVSNNMNTMNATKKIGDYELREQLSSSPQEVYKAWDARNNRWVVVRILRADEDPDTSQRILRQAEAASRLRHKKIEAIYKVEKSRQPPFIVSEYVEGESLLEWLERNGRTPRNVIPLSLQIAKALQAAHRQQVVHGNLSPSTVLVAPDGQAKIVDFALGGGISPELKDDSATQTLAATDPDVRMSALPYISPEQARGERLDPQSNLFSLGAILYQMTTGVSPFAGETPQQTLHRIYSVEPEPIVKFNPDFPPSWEDMLTRLMQKDRSRRYQNAGEFIAEASGLATGLFRGEKAVRTGRNLILVLVVIAAAGFVFWFDWFRLRSSSLKPEYIPVLATGELEGQPNIGPRGAWMVFISDRRGNPDVWLMDREKDESTPLQSTPQEEAWPSLSPDGSQIVFVRYSVGTNDPSLAEILTVGRNGTSERHILGAATFPTWTPDGSRIVFAKVEPGGKNRIGSAPLQNPGGWTYLTSEADGPLPHSAPAVSPDGKSIVYSAGSDPSAIWIKGNGERARPLVADNYHNRFPLWDPQSNRILYSSDKIGLWDPQRNLILYSLAKSGHFNIWSIELRPGAVGKQLTWLSMDIGRMTLDPATRAIIFERVDTTYEIHLHDSAAGTDKVAVSSRTRLSDISWNGPKQITYVRLTRKPQIWEMNSSGENPKMIMSDNHSNSYGAWSPDGDIFAFISDRSGTSELWMWQRSLGKTEQLTDSATPKQDVAWSKDGRAIAYSIAGEKRSQICILDITTRKTKFLVTPHSPLRPAWSWDNRWLYYQAQTERGLPQIYRISRDGGVPQQIDPGLSPSISASGELLFLSADQRAVLRIPKDKSRAETFLTAPNGSKLMEVTYSPDGKIVSYLTERKNSDIVSVSPASP